MYQSTSMTSRQATGAASWHPVTSDIAETRLWLDEHDWLYGVLKDEHNIAPSFRFPDLISACVSLVLADAAGPGRIFQFLRTELVLRAPQTSRRREAMWRPQYEALQDLQRSPANRHPNPKFQLDQLTTACVALVREFDSTGATVLRQARLNTALRQPSPPS